MDLSLKLRQQTKNSHDKIEEVPVLKKIVEKDVTLDDYQWVVKKFYGFIAPCEAYLSDQELFVHRRKTPLIEQDLISLGIPKDLHPLIPQCDQLPLLSNYEQMLGYLYVLEGSTLGGQIILKNLQNQLQLRENCGARFFNGYGKKTKLMWNEFCQLLNKVTDTTLQNNIISSAETTFHSLYQWLLIR